MFWSFWSKFLSTSWYSTIVGFILFGLSDPQVGANSPVLYEASQEYISVSQLLLKKGWNFTWHPYQGELLITSLNLSLELKQGLPVAIINGRQVLTLQEGLIFGPRGHYFLLKEDAEAISQQVDFYRRQIQGGFTTIIIDPGHGGKDSGAVSYYHPQREEVVFEPQPGFFEVREKDLVLQLGLLLKEYLDHQLPEQKIFLLRDQDVFLSLNDRVRIANDLLPSDPNRGIYLSLHANSSLSRKGYGFEVWHVPLNLSPGVRNKLASRSHFYNDQWQEQIRAPLNLLFHRAYWQESKKLAHDLIQSLDAAIGKFTVNRGVQAENFFVVTYSRMTSVLIEVGFVDHRNDVPLLLDETYLQKLVKGIYSGIKQYMREYGN